MDEDPRLIRVRQELSRYEHPLLDFDVRLDGDQVEFVIALKIAGIHDDVYSVRLTDREIGARNFPWAFHRLLYACVHDYLIEMFQRTPHTVEG